MLDGLKIYLKVARACRTPLVFLLDKKYREIPEKTLKEIAEHIKEKFVYINDISDCDDAALLFKAAASERLENGVGLVFGRTPQGLHAWNVAVCVGKVIEVEPQSATIGKRKGYWPWVVII
jgi:hypothetical protein